MKRTLWTTMAIVLLHGGTACATNTESSTPVQSVARQADIVTSWNMASVDIIADELKSPLPANRVVALVQTSVFHAVNAITGEYPRNGPDIEANQPASIDAAVAAANRKVLNSVILKSVSRIEATYKSAIDKIPPGEEREEGIAVGERAAKAVLDSRASDRVGVPESYRPKTQAGVYVPTVTPVASTWSDNRVPWALTSPDQFLPEAPPAFASEQWARDYNEIKTIGALDSKVRDADQTEAANFWIATSPRLYFQIVRSVTEQPGRDLTRNARLLAMAGQAVDDSLIAVFDAKYHFDFWRPVTAIRNGDIDNNDATDIQPDWLPLVTTPMHPEYPCAHCIVSGTIGHILKLDLGDEPIPTLRAASPTAGGVTRSWTTIDDFMAEVANARIWEGVHYRKSAEVGTEMGRQVAHQVASKFDQN